MRTSIVFFLFLLMATEGFSQDSSKTSTVFLHVNITTVPTADLSSGDTVYHNSLSLSPVLELRAKSGLGISYSPSFLLSGAKKEVYLQTLTAGFERYGQGKMDVVLDFSHYILHNGSAVPYTPINNEVFGYVNYNHYWIHPALAVSYGFGKDTTLLASRNVHELNMAAAIDHSFSWEEKGPFSYIELTPALQLNLSTSQYFSFQSISKYISHSHYFAKQLKKGGKKSGSTNPLSVSNVEMNLETSFEIGQHFSLHPEGSIYFPAGNSTGLSPFGYVQMGIQYGF